jgi:hypothetical protein
VKTLVKFLIFLVLVAVAVEFTTKGERGAFGGLFVKLGMVDPGENRTLKDRVEGKLDRARESEARRLGVVEENSEADR